jgi:hypothetical protein
MSHQLRLLLQQRAQTARELQICLAFREAAAREGMGLLAQRERPAPETPRQKWQRWLFGRRL